MAKAKRKRKPIAATGKVVDLLDILPARTAKTPSELRKGKKMLEQFAQMWTQGWQTLEDGFEVRRVVGLPGDWAASPQMPVEIKGRQSKRALRILLKRFGPSGLPPDDDTIETATQVIASDLETEAKEKAKAKGVEFDPKKVDPPKRDQVARVLRALGRNN
jgi:hypothetical protein